MPDMDDLPVPEDGRARRRRRRRDAAIYATAVLVSILFVVWVAFGAVTVSRQNRQILDGIASQNRAQLEQLTELIETNTVGDRTIVCLLNVAPEDRTEHTTQACVKAARAGDDHL